MTIQSWLSSHFAFVMKRFLGMRDKDSDMRHRQRRWGGNEARHRGDVLTPAHVILTSIRSNNHPEPEIFTALCVSVCKLTISSEPSETNSGSRERRGWTLMNCVGWSWIIDWEHLSHPWPHATAGENVEISSFLIFYKYSAATRINLTPAHQRGRGWDWEADFHQIKAWHSSYSWPG